MDNQQEAYSARSLSERCELPRHIVDHNIRIGELKAVKSGKQYVILREDALAWLRKCRDQGYFPSPVTQSDHERLAALNHARKVAA